MAVHLRKMMSNKYIHYGSSSFDLNKFGSVKNCTDMWSKPDPYTCLWASPIDSENSWIQWCTDNLFRLDELESWFTFELKSDAKILNIRNDDELQKAIDSKLLHNRTGDFLGYLPNDYYMDFEQLAQDGFDAIEVRVCSNRIRFCLHDWDCDSLLVLNPDCIVI